MYAFGNHIGTKAIKARRSGRWLNRMAYGSLLLACSCSSTGNDQCDESAGCDAAEPADTMAEEIEPAENVEFVADNDIAMKVRSVADAINVGEPIDSTDYNFEGVLTDGMGAPLFTDFEGLPGQWEVDVVSPKEVHIRNIGTGDLMPGSLMDYVTASINAVADDSESPELQLVDSYDSGDAQIEVYTYGRTSVQVETRPEVLPTGEVGPKLEITLRYDTLAH